MIATGITIDAWCASKLAHPNDGRIVQQTAFAQVGHQRAHGFVQHRQTLGLQNVVNALMIIPAAQVHFDERYTPTSTNRRAIKQPRPNALSP